MMRGGGGEEEEDEVEVEEEEDEEDKDENDDEDEDKEEKDKDEDEDKYGMNLREYIPRWANGYSIFVQFDATFALVWWVWYFLRAAVTPKSYVQSSGEIIQKCDKLTPAWKRGGELMVVAELTFDIALYYIG